MTERAFDLIIYGATGFAGLQAARYLDLNTPPRLRWAIAGRSKDKLEAVRSKLGKKDVPVVLADAGDPATLAAMTEKTKAIVSTVGPYSRYGTPLIEACLQTRTNYADITGETAWVRTLIDRFDASARQLGVRLVPFSGYDSVPSDAGTYALVDHVRKTRGVGVRRVEAFHWATGGFNGGTLLTFLDMMKQGQETMREPWLLSPGFTPTEAARALNRDPAEVRFHEGAKLWSAPFIMGLINARVVRRSAALFAERGAPYGVDFAYQEYFGARSRLAAWAMATAESALEATMRSSTGRSLIEHLGPKPGEGPSERAMDEGHFGCRYVAETEDGSRATSTMKGQGDPGNRSTVRFLIESGILLAGDTLSGGGGVLTPSTAFGGQLLERAGAHGLSYVIDP